MDIDAKQTEKDRRMQGVVDVISTKLNAIGMPSIDVPTLQTLGPKRAGELIDWAQLPTLGNGPGDSMAAIRNFGSDQAVAEKNPTLFRFINSLVSSPDYKAIAAMKQNDPKFQHLSYPEQREQIVQEVYNKQRADLDAAKGDNSRLNATNPYKLMHLNSQMNPDLKDNEFAKDIPVIAKTSTNGKTVEDKDMLLSFLGKVQAEPGKVSQYSAELASYYAKATKYQWVNSGMAVTGYPKFQQYGIKDPSGDKVINATSALELEAWAIRKMTADKSASIAGNPIWGFSGPPLEAATTLPPMR